MQQFILPLSSNTKYHPDEFIVSSSNDLVYKILKNWKTNWGVRPYETALLIKGPASCGKTYLTKLWQNESNACVITQKDWLKAENLLQYNNFIIEDIEKWNENKLFHLFNILNEHQKYLLMTCCNTHRQFKLPDLSSRISSVLNVEIKAPDDELIKILIFKHFSNSSIKINSDILEFLLVNLPRQSEKILQLLKIITDSALIHKRKITISFVKQLL